MASGNKEKDKDMSSSSWFRTVFGGFFGSSKGRIVNDTSKDPNPLEKATFSMECYWKPDALFGAQEGVVRTRVGYAGGTLPDPIYKNLKDHSESIQIEYDPNQITYIELLRLFWMNHSPMLPPSTDTDTKSPNRYDSIIHYHNEEQKDLAHGSKDAYESGILGNGKQAYTKIIPLTQFYQGEDWQQKYFLRQTRLASDFASDEDVMNSPLAAKLNGLVKGFVSSKKLIEDMLREEEANMSKGGKAYVEELLEKWSRRFD